MSSQDKLVSLQIRLDAAMKEMETNANDLMALYLSLDQYAEMTEMRGENSANAVTNYSEWAKFECDHIKSEVAVIHKYYSDMIKKAQEKRKAEEMNKNAALKKRKVQENENGAPSTSSGDIN